MSDSASSSSSPRIFDTEIDSESARSIVVQINVNYYLSLIAFAILYYDYLLTFGDEVRFFWRRRKANSVTILFFLNRYLSILGIIPVVLQSFRSWSDKGCDALQKFHQFFSVLVQIIVGVILIIRTYALYERNVKIAIIMAIFAFIVVCIGVWAILGKSSVVEEPFDLSFMLGCHPLIAREEAIRLAAAWGGLLLFDSVIFTLTLVKAIAIWKLGTRRLFHVLVRDGTIYYLVLAMANLSNILTFLIGEPVLRGVSTTFANAISVTMLSRLMLNLQNPHLFETRWNTQSRSYTTTGTGTYVGPFVTTILDRDGVTTTDGSRFVESGSMGRTETFMTTTDGMRSQGQVDSDVRWDEEELEEEMFARPASALWYDRAWVSGSRSASGNRTGDGNGSSDVAGPGTGPGTGPGSRDRIDDAPEEVDLLLRKAIGQTILYGISMAAYDTLEPSRPIRMALGPVLDSHQRCGSRVWINLHQVQVERKRNLSFVSRVLFALHTSSIYYSRISVRYEILSYLILDYFLSFLLSHSRSSRHDSQYYSSSLFSYSSVLYTYLSPLLSP
ncbi:hypothetical protein ACEPAG_2466 [Sanghuangporus baumii]